MRSFVFLCLLFFASAFFLISCKQEAPSIPVVSGSQVATDTIAIKGDADISIFKKNGDAYVIPWKYLMAVKFEDSYNEKLGMEVSMPVFSDTLKVLDGKLVEVEGFYIPVDETGDDKIVILSAFPFAQCFFCGKAGVESIIDILSPTKLPVLKVDTKIKFKGRLKLNRDNFDYLIYVLEEAEMIR